MDVQYESKREEDFYDVQVTGRLTLDQTQSAVSVIVFDHIVVTDFKTLRSSRSFAVSFFHMNCDFGT